MHPSMQLQASRTSNSFWQTAGMVWGGVVVLVVFVLSRLGIFDIPGLRIGQESLISLVCILGAAIPGTIVAWIVFRAFKKASSARVRIAVSVLSGIVGGVIAALIICVGVAAWFVYTYCC